MFRRECHQHNSIKRASHLFRACEKQRSQSDKELSFFPTSSLGIELTFPWQPRQSLSLPAPLPHALIISLSSVNSLNLPLSFYCLFVWPFFLFYKVASNASAFQQAGGTSGGRHWEGNEGEQRLRAQNQVAICHHGVQRVTFFMMWKKTHSL